MKRQEYNGEFDVFETPENLWDRVEAALETPTKKRRGIFWWSAAAGIALLIGIGSYVQNSRSCLVDPITRTAKNDVEIKTPEIQPTPTKPVVDSAENSSEHVEITPDSLWVSMPSFDMSSANVSYNVSTNNAILSTSPLTYSWAPTTSTTSTLSFSNAYSGSYGFTTGSGNGAVSGVISTYAAPGTAYFSSNRNPEENVGRLGSDIYISDDEDSEGSVYDPFTENEFIAVTDEPQSTFSIDVDGASYSDVRGAINRGQLPDRNAVRIEEFINYFPYDYEKPKGDSPFATHTEIGNCPWNEAHKLLKIGISGRAIEKANLPKNNLVFLLDVSGSMMSADKLELIKKGFNLLVQELREEDKVSICVYAGAAGQVLPPTSGFDKDRIMEAINRLEAGGSTAGGEGIELAYKTALENFDPNGNNRVILATDGDFNVGISGDEALIQLIEEKRKSGIFLTVLGVGHDNFQSSKMEKIANNGNGNFSYIDNILEAKKVLVTEMGATLQTIAKDVKLQLEFNPSNVQSYRLIGYENRLLANEDFANDTVDAGELGAGHTVTALYEIVPADGSEASNSGSELRYSTKAYSGNNSFQDEYATLNFRYKEPDGNTSKLIETVIKSSGGKISTDFQFVQSVAEFGMLLRDSKYLNEENFDRILRNAREGRGLDPYGYRSEYIQLVEKTKTIMNGNNVD